MRYCTACGHRLPDDARFCTSCGTAVQRVPDEPVAAPPAPAPPAPAPPAPAPPAPWSAAPAPPAPAPPAPAPPAPWSAAPATAVPLHKPAGPAGDHGTAAPAAPLLRVGSPFDLARDVVAVVAVLVALSSSWDGAGRSIDNVLVVLAALLVLAAVALPYLLVPAVTGRSFADDQVQRLRFALAAPMLLLVLVTVLRALSDERGIGIGAALGLVAALLAVQSRWRRGSADAQHEGLWVVAVVGLYAFSAAWGLLELLLLLDDLGFGLGVYVWVFLLPVLWAIGLAAWFAARLAMRRAEDWAAGLVVGGLLCVTALLVSQAEGLESVDVSAFALTMGAAALSAAPQVAGAVRPPLVGATGWIRTVAGLWTVAASAFALGVVLVVLQLAQDFVFERGALVWLLVVNVVALVGALVARSMLLRDPVRGRLVTVILSGVLALVSLITYVSVVDSAPDVVTVVAGGALPVFFVVVLTVPASVRRELGPLLPGTRAAQG